MKTLLPALLVLIFGLHLANAQTPEWKWQNPLPTGCTIRSTSFVNENLGWAATECGSILKTTDGGLTWNGQQTGTTNYLYHIHFIDPQNGWSVGEGGLILKTNNGGQNWTTLTSGTNQALYSIKFVNLEIGIAVGKNGTIIKTTNGGTSWFPQNSQTPSFLNTVYCSDSQLGYAVGGFGAIIKTTNGGNDWIAQNSGISYHIYSACFINADTGWVVGDIGKCLKTTNGGTTWVSLQSGTSETINSINFISNKIGWLVTESGNIRKTTNGGNSWVAQNSGTNAVLFSLQVFDPLHVLIGGANGTILKTTNGGSSWTTHSSFVTLKTFNSVHFINGQMGWAAGEEGKILKTTNGGLNWFMLNSGTVNKLKNIFFIDPYTGWAVGEGGTILKTTNAGNDWQTQISPNPGHINAVWFVDESFGWAVTSSGAVLKTTNGGNNWQNLNFGVINSLNSVHFINPQTGWVVGNNGIIRKTINGGVTWQNQDQISSYFLNSVRFLNDQEGWAIGGYATTLKTTNGGQTWLNLNSGISLTHNLHGLSLIDHQIAYVVGTFGSVYQTTNGGVQWTAQFSGTSESLNSVCFANTQNGWTVGGNGNILASRTNDGFNSQIPTSLISGIITRHSGTNCNPNPQEAKIPGRFVKALPGPYYGVSNGSGLYQLRLPIDSHAISNYTLSAIPVQNHGFQSVPICPVGNSYSIMLDSVPDTLVGKNFAYQVTDCHHLNVQISSNRRRRCFKNNTTVTYFNQGAIPALDAHILVEFPKWVRPISASHPHVAVNDSTWKFELGSVTSGFVESIYIIDSVICGQPEILNLTQCTRATIFPAPDCPPPSGWSGAEISVVSQCNNGMVDFGVYNATAFTMTDSVDYWVYLDSIQVKVGKIKLAAGDSLHFWVQTNGMSATFTINQVAGHPESVFVSAVVEDCSNTTFYPRQMANQFPKSQTPNSKTHCLPIRDSYDPNDKQVFPIGFTANRIVKPGTQLEYLIRFQNTGNDTAYTVFVIDSLDKNLNVESLEMGAVSHPYDISLQTTRNGRHFLRFQFNHINLPDSNTNELRSHGFIQYRISPKIGLPLGSQARNRAAIYFDFNPAVVTNQTLTTFDNITFTNPALNPLVQVITSSQSVVAKQIGVKLYPNPVTQNQLTVEFETTGTLTIFNAQGQMVMEQQNQAGKEQINLSISPGIYWVKLQTTEGVSVQKLVKR